MNRKKIIITISLVVSAIIIYLIVYFVDVYKIIGNVNGMAGDWEVYNTTEELVNNVDYIYEGTVTGYHYEVLDIRTGQKFKKKSEADCMFGIIYTVYEIDVKEKYKGEIPSKITIEFEGGIMGEDELKQGILLKNAGLSERTVRSKVMDVGETYLFTTCLGTGINHCIPSPEQHKFDQDKCYGTENVNYDTIKKYVTAPEYANPPEVPTKYIESDSKLLSTPEEIVAGCDKVFEGIVGRIEFFIEDSQLVTMYRIIINNVYKGEKTSCGPIYIEGGTDVYEVKEQYRILNSNKITERMVYKGLNSLEKGKTYIFAVNGKDDSWKNEPGNPAQFAFCSDNSNAPGGIDYKMMKEYLEK